MTYTVALIGGRGYTGAEMLGLLASHPQLELAFASSSSQAGQLINDVCPSWPDPEAAFISLQPENAGTQKADAWVLAVPNGAASGWAHAIREAHPDSVILDLSADHRFNPGWAYGLPERYREKISRSKSISNPGCYATGAQLGLLPVVEYLVGTPVVFGVSGYSGAGRTPSDKNNPERLHDNLIPYSLTGHMHEKEVSHQLERDVRFLPHVAPFFRGISLTFSVKVDHEATPDKLLAVYSEAFRDEARIRVTLEIPEVKGVRDTPDVHIGGFAVDERDPCMFSLVVVLDNLSKGAATQAIQNLNLALGINESTGINHE
jgi:N-acetyl-gamma-glutamyl-phosphate reductase